MFEWLADHQTAREYWDFAASTSQAGRQAGRKAASVYHTRRCIDVLENLTVIRLTTDVRASLDSSSYTLQQTCAVRTN